MDYKELVAKRLKEYLDMEITDIISLIEIPPKPEMGDYAFPCFQLAKTFRKAPNMIAKELEEKINKEGFEKISALGPYINFFMDKGVYVKNTVEEILDLKEKYGTSNIGAGKNVTIDYSSPNIAKPFHIGHLSTTAIGNSLYKILQSQGYNCIGINHIGDWGTQFGKLIVAYHKWADEEKLEKDPINELLRIYVKFHEEAEKDPSLNDMARAHFKNLEDGKEEETVLWKKFKELSLREFNRIYDLLGVKFDSFNGEAFYNDKMDPIVDLLQEKGLLVDSNGAKVVMLDEYNMPPCIIKKSDGATIYATRDLAAAKYRKDTYDFYKNIYVFGNTQALHFRQFSTVLKKAGFKWADDMVHVGFGLVKLADKKLSTRHGDVVFLEELLHESIAKTLEIINEKNPNLENKEEVAKKIGVGAVIFSNLKNSREKDIVFKWEDVLSFEGESGPYVQYTYARGKSILRKADVDYKDADLTLLNSFEEFELVKLLGSYKKWIDLSIEKYEPSMITRYTLEVAKAFNKFYNAKGILNADTEVKKARLCLVEAADIVIKSALGLIGVETVEKM
ncbi:MAG: arginine--tRNA ligase [Bacillota bacterium]|nr:arginine--tRNA ligase [Bacillota bacterium]